MEDGVRILVAFTTSTFAQIHLFSSQLGVKQHGVFLYKISTVLVKLFMQGSLTIKIIIPTIPNIFRLINKSNFHTVKIFRGFLFDLFENQTRYLRECIRSFVSVASVLRCRQSVFHECKINVRIFLQAGAFIFQQQGILNCRRALNYLIFE